LAVHQRHETDRTEINLFKVIIHARDLQPILATGWPYPDYHAPAERKLL
jgi:hypothetical protein